MTEKKKIDIQKTNPANSRGYTVARVGIVVIIALVAAMMPVALVKILAPAGVPAWIGPAQVQSGPIVALIAMMLTMIGLIIIGQGHPHDADAEQD